MLRRETKALPRAPGRSAESARRGKRPRALPTHDALRCIRKFRRFYPGGFLDVDYIAAERSYKERAHQQWQSLLPRATHQALNAAGDFQEAASIAVRIESRTNLLFSFEKMALRDAVRSAKGARLFSKGLYDFLYGEGALEPRFARWVEAVRALPRRQTRVLTWPVLTVFPFIAEPRRHVFLKPNVTKIAAREFGFDFNYSSQPRWDTYASLVAFAAAVEKQLTPHRDLRPRDMIDIQSFIWVQGSDEYEEGGKHAG